MRMMMIMKIDNGDDADKYGNDGEGGKDDDVDCDDEYDHYRNVNLLQMD